MTTLYESPTHRQDDIDCVVQCLGEIVDLQCGFPDGSLDDGAGQWTTAMPSVTTALPGKRPTGAPP
jgi:hypothetical protein